jgi:hypothetical protein
MYRANYSNILSTWADELTFLAWCILFSNFAYKFSTILSLPSGSHTSYTLNTNISNLKCEYNNGVVISEQYLVLCQIQAEYTSCSLNFDKNCSGNWI